VASRSASRKVTFDSSRPDTGAVPAAATWPKVDAQDSACGSAKPHWAASRVPQPATSTRRLLAAAGRAPGGKKIALRQVCGDQSTSAPAGTDSARSAGGSVRPDRVSWARLPQPRVSHSNPINSSSQEVSSCQPRGVIASHYGRSLPACEKVRAKCARCQALSGGALRHPKPPLTAGPGGALTGRQPSSGSSARTSSPAGARRASGCFSQSSRGAKASGVALMWARGLRRCLPGGSASGPRRGW